MTDTITVFKGDGIGPEITDCVLRILDAAGADLNYEVFNVGAAEYEAHGELIPKEGYASMKKTHILLKSPITTPLGKGFRSLNVTLRKKYDLYANIRPAKTNSAVKTAFENVDIVIFRENTEDLYAGVEEMIDKDTVHSIKIITRKCCERIIRAAFDYAVSHKRKKVTCVHKANIMKMADGMFRDIFYDISKEYPDIEADDKIVDNVAMQLVMHPEKFDIIVTETCMAMFYLIWSAASSEVWDFFHPATWVKISPCSRQFTAVPLILQDRELQTQLRSYGLHVCC